jgi:hypothetical protein
MAQMKRQQQAFIDKSQTQESKMETDEAAEGEEEASAEGEAAPAIYARHPTAVLHFVRDLRLRSW